MLDSDTISSWLRIKNSGISIDKDAAADYISNMANKYNTIYVPRTFHTSLGTDVTVSDNEYGYRIDQDAELTQLLEDLKSGEDVSREPVYSSSGMKRNGTDDLAGNYIEVSLDSQHLWLYKDGALVTETDIVSGAPTPERETYRGAWPIAYKASPFTLSSEEYGYAETVNTGCRLFMDRDFMMHHGSLHLVETDIRQDMEVTAVSICRKIRRH